MEREDVITTTKKINIAITKLAMTNLQCCVGDYHIQISSTNPLQTTVPSHKVLSPTCETKGNPIM